MGLTGVLVAVFVLLAATAFGAYRKATDGKVRSVSGGISHLHEPGKITLLQFSSAFCAPCRATRVVCAEVARTTPGVAHLEIDAESQLDTVRALGIRRTPTVLIIAPGGEIVGRAEGALTLAQVRTAIGAVHA
jgi:thiol-disulfide isomerase/thioredoxin